MDREFVATRSPGRLLLLLLGCALFVAASAWIAFGDRATGLRYWLAAAGMPFFGLCGLYFLTMIFAKGPEIAVGPRGILWRRWTGDYVPWAAMAEVRPVTVGKQHMLAITLRDAGSYPLTGLLGRMQGANRSMMGGGDVFVTIVGTDCRFEDLLEAVARFAPPSLRN